TRKHDTKRDAGVRSHMEKSALDVQITMPPAHEKQCSCGVDQNSYARYGHDRRTRNFLRMTKALNRFPRDCSDGNEQKNGVCQRSENRGTAQTIGETLAGLGLSEFTRAPGE